MENSTYSNYFYSQNLVSGCIKSSKKTALGRYVFGFNGKEKDNEIKGEGNSYDYGYRIYDPRIGKFLSIDKLTKDYPWYSPFQFAGNKPIIAIDLDGLEELIVIYGPVKNVGGTEVQQIDIIYVSDIPANNVDDAIKGYKKRVDEAHPELGLGGVEYRYPDGRVERTPDLVPGSPEDIVMNKQRSYVDNDGTVKNGTKRQTLGKKISLNSSLIYTQEHLWTVLTATYPNMDSKNQYSAEGVEYVTKFMNKYKNMVAEVVGYTDRDPMVPYITPNDKDGNDRLSLERANDIRNELIKAGINAGRLNTSGKGSSQADQSCKNPKDRKVNTIIYDKGQN